MKTVYISKGETVQHESLVTEHLIVDGCLKTAYDVRAKTISGSGVILADSISADDIRADELEANLVICKRLTAKRVSTPELYASEYAAVSCFLTAAYVKTKRLLVANSEIDEYHAEEVVHLGAKKRSLLGFLFTAGLQAWLLRLFAWSSWGGEAVDAEFESAEDEDPPEEEPENEVSEEADEELNRIVSMFKLARESGYTLRLVPGKPEENAPVFDFNAEKILRPAA